MRKEESKPKKKGSTGQVVMMLIMLAVGGVCGAAGMDYVIGTFGNDEMGFGGFLLLLAGILVCLYAAMLFQIIVHEGGHLIFGLASGYRFLSFRILGLMLVKTDSGLRLKRFSLAGTAGQCLMAPPEIKDGKMPYVLYNLGGVLMNLLTAVLSAVLFVLFRDVAFLGLLCFCSAAVGIAFALMNGIPLTSGGVDNDGRNIVSISKSESAVKCFRIQMLVSAKTGEGVRLRDMPDEWFELPADADMNNAIVSAVRVFAFNRLMDRGDYTAARELGETLVFHDGVLEIYRMIIASELIFCELLGEKRSEVIDRYKTKQFDAFAKAMKTNPSLLRMQIAYELIRNGDEAAAEKKREAFEKAAKSYPYAHEIEGERDMLADADREYRALKERKYTAENG